MAPELDLSTWSLRRRNRLLVTGAIAGLLLLLAVALTGVASVLLLATWACGVGLTYSAGLPLRLEERLAWGAPVGAVVVGMLLLLLGFVAGLSGVTVIAALLLAIALGAAVAWPYRRGMVLEVEVALDRWAGAEPWPLWVLLAACWPYAIVLLGRSYTFTTAGLLSGTTGAYADWAAHLSFATSFAYGQNFPPQFPIFAGHAMTYPFLIDLWAAGAIALGSAPTSALTVTSGMLALALPPAIYFGWLRLAGQRGAAALATFLFLLSGGLGFLLFFGDLHSLGGQMLVRLPRLYTQETSVNLQWLNSVLAWIVPQRSVLLGYALVPLVLGVLWSARASTRWAPFVAAGALTGLTPLCHLHAYGTLFALGLWWALLQRRRQWLGFLLPALVLGAPQAIWLSLGGAASLHLQPGWLASADGAQQSGVFFWLWNAGLLVPLMVAAFLWRGVVARSLSVHLLPIWLWFLVPNFVVFQAWDWDNTKFLAYWLLVGTLPVALLLVRVWKLGRTRLAGAAGVVMRVGAPALTAVCIVVLVLAGALDLARSLDTTQNTALFVDEGGVQAAAWVRDHTPATAVFAVAPEHNEAIPTLAGRRIVAGYPGWLWTYGLPGWSERVTEEETILQGGVGTPQLVRDYDVGYVVLGPQELDTYHGNVRYWEAAGQLVYDQDGYAIFRVRSS